MAEVHVRMQGFPGKGDRIIVISMCVEFETPQVVPSSAGSSEERSIDDNPWQLDLHTVFFWKLCGGT